MKAKVIETPTKGEVEEAFASALAKKAEKAKNGTIGKRRYAKSCGYIVRAPQDDPKTGRSRMGYFFVIRGDHRLSEFRDDGVNQRGSRWFGGWTEEEAEKALLNAVRARAERPEFVREVEAPPPASLYVGPKRRLWPVECPECGESTHFLPGCGAAWCWNMKCPWVPVWVPDGFVPTYRTWFAPFAYWAWWGGFVAALNGDPPTHIRFRHEHRLKSVWIRGYRAGGGGEPDRNSQVRYPDDEEMWATKSLPPSKAMARYLAGKAKA